MSITIPYFRIYRPFGEGGGLLNFEYEYILDSRYASNLTDLIRGYHQLEKELIGISDFVEPSDANANCYSHRLYALLLRASTEFETNAKSILQANGYNKSGNWNITD